MPPCAAPASTTSLPEFVEEVSAAAAPCKRRGPIKRKTGEKPRSDAGDDMSSCPEAPVKTSMSASAAEGAPVVPENKPRGIIEGRTSDRLLAHHLDDIEPRPEPPKPAAKDVHAVPPCAASPLSPGRKRACAEPGPPDSDEVLDTHAAKKERPCAENPEVASKPASVASSEPVIQDADGTSSPAHKQPTDADDDHARLVRVRHVPPSHRRSHDFPRCLHRSDGRRRRST